MWKTPKPLPEPHSTANYTKYLPLRTRNIPHNYTTARRVHRAANDTHCYLPPNAPETPVRKISSTLITRSSRVPSTAESRAPSKPSSRTRGPIRLQCAALQTTGRPPALRSREAASRISPCTRIESRAAAAGAAKCAPRNDDTRPRAALRHSRRANSLLIWHTSASCYCHTRLQEGGSADGLLVGQRYCSRCQSWKGGE